MLVDGSGGALTPLAPTGPVPRSAGCGIEVADAPTPLAPGLADVRLPLAAAPPMAALVTDGGLAADAVVAFDAELFAVEPLAPAAD